MDRRFLTYYEKELTHIRETASEFGARFSKIAGRLGLDPSGSSDPYVERLIEAFAFLTARIQHRLGAAHGEFTEHMLELLYPNYLAPTPSMAVLELQPNMRQSSLVNGSVVPRGSVVRSELGAQQTACEYRTGHPVTLWPLELEVAEYRAGALGDLIDLERVGARHAKAALRLVLRTNRELSFDRLALDSLPLFVSGNDKISIGLYEALVCANVGMVARSADRNSDFHRTSRQPAIAPLGFEEGHALLPVGQRGFDGYRLLQEFFAFPQRFMFAELSGLRQLLRGFTGSAVELFVLFDRVDPRLDGVVRTSHVALFCTPAINLFPRSGDRVALHERDHEYHVVPDRTRPQDFEVHSVTRVLGCSRSGADAYQFSPMYAPVSGEGGTSQRAHYAIHRRARTRSQGRSSRENDSRFPYVSTDLFLSLVDGDHGPFRADITQLSVDTLCTNRALPLTLASRDCGFSMQSHGAAVGVRCVAGPTPPRVSPAFGETSWSFLSHLSLDYSTLFGREGDSASALRQLLDLYGHFADGTALAQSRAVVGVQTAGVVRALPLGDGPQTFGRGIEVSVMCDEDAFEGTGAVLLGAVLERFFAKYASINSFVETVLCTQQRGEVMRWSATLGQRTTL